MSTNTYNRWAVLGAFVAGCVAITATPARANLLPYLSSTTAATDGNTTFNYSVSLSTDERIDGTSDPTGYTAFFTIYDFAGYVMGSIVAPSDWTASAQLIGITPDNIVVPDDPGIYNLTFTYVGSASIDGTGQTFTGFSAESTDSAVNDMAYFAQQSTKNAGPAIGGRDFGAGPESVPMSGVPEPSTWMMLGAGLALVGAKLIARKRLA